MRNTKFVSLLKILSVKELDEFHLYLKGRYPRQKAALQVFEYIKPFHPQFKDDVFLSQQIAFSKLFPEEPFKNKKLLNLLSDLSIFVENFIVTTISEKDKIFRELLLLEFYTERTDNDLFEKQRRKILRNLKSIEQKDGLSYFNLGILHHLSYYRTVSDKMGKDITQELIDADNNLDLTYYLLKLQNACEFASRNLLTSETNPTRLLSETLSLFQQKYQDQNLITHRAYLIALKLIQLNKESLFDQLFSYLTQNGNFISHRNKLVLIMYLINFAAQCIRNKKSSYFHKSFQVYNYGNKNNIFIKDGLIDVANFNNAIVVACTIKEFNWAQDFLEKWKQYLNKSIRNDTVILNMAKIHFEKGDYDKTLKLLRNIEKFEYDYYKLRAGLLQIRSYWLDGDQYDSIFVLSKIRNYEGFVKRNRLFANESKVGFLNFVKVFREIVRANKPKQKIVEQFNKYEIIVCKDWLEKELLNYKPFLYGKG